MAEAQSLIGVTVSHYRITEVIGSGGMGVVYRAHDEQLDRDVAVKVLPHGRIGDESARKRFRKEALALAKMNHANIETVHEFASENDVDYLVTEYIPGKTLTEVIRGGALPEKEVVALGTQIAAALEEAHERGIVHCDLKPANIIVTAKRQVKVLDFGLATLLRPAAEATTVAGETGVFAGTLPYMAPEQLSGKGTDSRTDVYALGLVLYEMATGLRAFQQDSVQALVGLILNQMPAPVRGKNPSVSAELERIIFKACDKDPERRYQSAREMRIDLERLATPTTASVAPAHSDTVWQGIWRVSRRHPRGLAVSIGISTVAIVAIFWFVGTRPVLSFAPRDWILLTDFDNQTGETVFDKSLLTALTVSLEQSAHANVFPRARIPDALKRMNKPATAAIDENIGREICLREHLRGLVSCRIARIGQEYIVSAELINPQNGVSVRSYLERVKGQEGVLTGLDTIANKLRRDLGESLGSIKMADRPLPLVTTSSLQALKSYVDASEQWSKGNTTEAVQLFKNAVQLDPEFAMAHAALGGAYYSFMFNDPVDGKAEYEKALQLSARTTERERAAIQVGYAADQRHYADATNLYHIYLDKYPDDWRIRSNFAAALRYAGQYQEAIEQYQQVIRVAPEDAGAYIDLATSYLGVGNLAEALRNYDKAFELEPGWKTSSNLNHEYGFALVRSGDDAAAVKVFEAALAKPEMKGLAERSLGWLALYHGQYRAAKTHFETSLSYFKAAKAPLSEARTDLLLAIVANGQGDRAELMRMLKEAEQFLPNSGLKVWMGTQIGYLYARTGTPDRAEQILQAIKPAVDLENADQSSQFHRLEGEIALARGQKSQALTSFNLAQNEKSGDMTTEPLARAYALAGDKDQSISWYEKYVNTSDAPLGYEVQQDWLEAHYRLAELYLSSGQKDKATPLLEKLTTLWKDGDADLPILKQARAEYAKLK
ncbi:MAG TPA: protein kinase [Candidatus Methylomirabilis sp.]|nr:protein kinase [Candidatus Methylomirabilis sp.]